LTQINVDNCGVGQEGSAIGRDVMPAQTSKMHASVITADQLRAIVGDIDDAKVIGILDLQPTVAELEEAAIWAQGDGDVLARAGRPLSGKVAEIDDRNNDPATDRSLSAQHAPSLFGSWDG